MAQAELITEMVRAHTLGDERRWRNLLSQLIAAESRAGHTRQAARLRALLAEAKTAEPERSSRQSVGGPVPLARAPRDLADVLDVRYSDVQLADLVLPDELRGSVQRVLDEQRQAGRLAEHGLMARRRLLLHGPPGCGKTMAAHALAGELKLPLARVRLEVLFNRYLGETAATLTDIFDHIGRVRAVYLFDEFDALGKHRSDEFDVGEAKRVVGTFLQLLDACDSDSLIVAATNLGETLDSALLRRFDDVLEFPAPTVEARALLLRRLLRTVPVGGDEVKKLAKQSEGLSFAEVQAAVDNARKAAILDDREFPSLNEIDAEVRLRVRGASLKTGRA
ncbi:AAA family ATPase [Amycolatopsis alkalitolerans]|uniref:ATP-binding protein n=1 Tax=Amycolatopsis alkalitolerans TaxID=2547244 RepID=A0A5C4M8D6_9PSEU|nr:ATP-binding protein [Amycolatopsis alkalitolerans]TNC28023.1 ATP-binding protein [Amycolatopsis alkalitolerans]